MPTLDRLTQETDTTDGISVRREGPVVEVVLSRPQVKNALDLTAWQRLAAVFRELADLDDNIVIVLSGAGGDLSVGSDISQFPEHRTGMARAEEYNAAIDDALIAVGRVQHPVIAMISGMAVGGGCELACAADIRVASADSRFGVPIARLGVSIGAVEARTLLRVLSPARLKDFLLTGRMIDAKEAYRIGLIDRVVPTDELVSTTRELAETVARGAPLAARANKLTVNAVADGSLEPAAGRIRELTEAIYEGDDLQEGIRAFAEKRRAQFGQAQPPVRDKQT
jgi:enoyl-CoA hydratase